EQTLMQKMKSNPQAMLYNTKDRYVIRLDTPGGWSERYGLRKQDLLVDAYERYYNEQLNSTIKFHGYDLVDGRYLLPTYFTVTVQTGGTFSAKVTEMYVNEKGSQQMFQMAVPDGFERMAL